MVLLPTGIHGGPSAHAFQTAYRGCMWKLVPMACVQRVPARIREPSCMDYEPSSPNFNCRLLFCGMVSFLHLFSWFAAELTFPDPGEAQGSSASDQLRPRLVPITVTP